MAAATKTTTENGFCNASLSSSQNLHLYKKYGHTVNVYRIYGQVKQYLWGKSAEQSLVARYYAANNIQAAIDFNENYAELWIGTHPSAPSMVRLAGQEQKEGVPIKGPLSDVIQNDPFFLDAKYNGVNADLQLPYLLKVLSIRTALSIQAHPDKKLAKELYKTKPHMYPDANHKPEMCVALSEFEGMCGFKPIRDIISAFYRVPEFKALVSDISIAHLEDAVNESPQSEEQIKLSLKMVFEEFMNTPQAIVTTQVEALNERLLAMPDHSSWKDDDELFVRLNTQFPNDIGCFAAFLLNHVRLKPGQAFFMGANEPHAYVSGNCMEIMACSDNVVRAGLTPKAKDVDVLVSMLTYDYGAPPVFDGEVKDNFTRLYSPPDYITEFQLEKITLPPGATDEMALIHAKSPSVVFCAAGEGWLIIDETGNLSMNSSSDKRVSLFPGAIFYLPTGCTASITQLCQSISLEMQVPITLFRASVNEKSWPLYV